MTLKKARSGPVVALDGIVDPALERLCINTVRMLSIDAVQKANWGYPGMPLGAATMAFVLWTRHLRHDPTTHSGPIAIASFSLRDTPAHCCTACCSSPGMSSQSTTFSSSVNGRA